MHKPQVLLLEDDPAIARTAAYALEREGLSVIHSLLKQDAESQLRSRTFDLLVLDVSLPDGNGLDVLRGVRGGMPDVYGICLISPQTPVLMLSARGEEIDRVLGLELGADDYLTKPFSPRELAARVKALLRRSAATSHSAASVSLQTTPVLLEPSMPYLAGQFEHDQQGQRISLRGNALPLTRREYHLLAHLLQGAGRIFSRDTLLNAAWGDDNDSTDRTVDTHIKTLRAKLREAAPDHQGDFITTHRGMGYSLTSSCTENAPSPAKKA